MIRLVLTGVAAFVALAFGYHQFASSSGGAQTVPPAASQTTARTVTTSSAPVRPPAKLYRRLGVDVDRVQAALDAVAFNADMCHDHWPAGVTPMSPSCAALRTTWNRAYGAAQRDFASATRVATGGCKTALVAYFGPRSAAARLPGLIRQALRGEGPQAEAGARQATIIEVADLFGRPAIRAIQACQPATS